eukprot:jgi/Chlat1/7381/Chrsp6S07410
MVVQLRQRTAVNYNNNDDDSEVDEVAAANTTKGDAKRGKGGDDAAPSRRKRKSGEAEPKRKAKAAKVTPTADEDAEASDKDEPGADNNEDNPAESQLDTLLDVVKFSEQDIPTAVEDWVQKYEGERTAAMSELLTFLIQACGSKIAVDKEAVEDGDVDFVVERALKSVSGGQDQQEDLLHSKDKKLKHFKKNFANFWDELVSECRSSIIFDEFLFPTCINYIIALAGTAPRPFRSVSTIAGLQLVSSFVHVAKSLSETRETTQRQLTAELKKKRSGKDSARATDLQKALEEAHKQISTIEQMMEGLFTGLFVRRYRDVDASIRADCIKAVGDWIVTYPSYFWKDTYLKYVGWTLNDKTASVRLTSVRVLCNLYANEEHLAQMDLFTSRFAKRMLELANDADVEVAVAAIDLLRQLMSQELLDGDDLGSLYELLVDDTPQVRQAIGALVYDHLFGSGLEEPTPGSAKKGKKKDQSEEQLLALLQILADYRDSPVLCHYVIDALWENAPVLQDWKSMTQLLLTENTGKELSEVDATNLTWMLAATVKKACLEDIVPTADTARHNKAGMSKAKKDALAAHKQQLTTVLSKALPELLSKYQVDKAKVPSLVEIVKYMDLSQFTSKRQEKVYESLLQQIVDVFFKQNEDDALQACIHTLRCCAYEGDGALREPASDALRKCRGKVMERLQGAIGSTDPYELQMSLKRAHQLQQACSFDQPGLYEMVSAVLYDKDAQLQPEASHLQVQCFAILNLFFALTWEFTNIDASNPSTKSINDLVSKRQEFWNYLFGLLSEFDTEQAAVSELASTVYNVLADLMLIFSKNKYEGTPLAQVGLQPSSKNLELFWELAERRLAAAGANRETDEENPDLEDEVALQQINTLLPAVKLVAYGCLSQDWLGPEIVSHFTQHGKGVAEVVKVLCAKIKKSQSHNQWRLFLDALKRAYERHLKAADNEDEPDPDDSLQVFHNLAIRVAAIYTTFGGLSMRTTVAKIVRGGLEYAFADAPKRLSFIQSGLTPFTAKLSINDVAAIVSEVQEKAMQLRAREGDDDWKPLFAYISQLQDRRDKVRVDGEGSSRKQKKKLSFAETDTTFGDEDVAADDIDAEEEEQPEPAPVHQPTKQAVPKAPKSVPTRQPPSQLPSATLSATPEPPQPHASPPDSTAPTPSASGADDDDDQELAEPLGTEDFHEPELPESDEAGGSAAATLATEEQLPTMAKAPAKSNAKPELLFKFNALKSASDNTDGDSQDDDSAEDDIEDIQAINASRAAAPKRSRLATSSEDAGSKRPKT